MAMVQIMENRKSEEESKFSIQDQQDALEQLLNPEVQHSLITLIEQLPKLTELVNVFTKSYDFVKAATNDEILKNDTLGAIKEIAEPLKYRGKSLAATFIEARDLADESKEVIGLFGLLKMLKDPQAQKLFRFVNAYLAVSAQRSNN